MPGQKTEHLELRYGRGQRLRCHLPAERLMAYCPAPAALENLDEVLQESLRQPLDFPPLRDSVFPDDRVVVVLDRDVSAAAELIAGLWREMESAGVRPDDLLILQPADRGRHSPADPRQLLPAEIRRAVRWRVHASEEGNACGYLASSASGERLYLARDVLDADVVLTVGQMAFDPLLGFRGTNSVLYPGLSDAEAARRSLGVGHRELEPDDNRPLRMLADEIGWLLGVQFTLQVLPAVAGGVAGVLAGATDSVFRRARQLLMQQWMLHLPGRCEVVVLAIDQQAPGAAWEKLGAALAAARNIVSHGGRVIVLSDLSAPPGKGVELLRDSLEPADALQALRQQAPPDLLPATQLAHAVDWAQVFLLSHWESDLVEELFMVPLEEQRDVNRLLEGEESCVLLESAQYAAATVNG